MDPSRVFAQQFNPEQRVVLKELNLTDVTCDNLTAQIHLNLQEPNIELIEKIILLLGIPKTVELYDKTRELEFNGGMSVKDGTRRRTPGGAFFYIINNDPTIPKNVLKEIFFDTSQILKKQKIEDAKLRRQKHNEELKDMLIKDGFL